MSNDALDWVFAHSRSKGAARLVLLSLADRARHSNGNCWPSVADTAQRTALTERAVQIALRQLEGSHEIVTYRNKGPGGTNLYHLPLIHTPEPGSGVNDVRGENDDTGGRNLRPGGVNHVHPNPRENPVEPSDLRGVFLPGSGWVRDFRPALRVVE